MIATGRASDADSDEALATIAYLSAAFLGPVVPLAVYLLRRRRSEFLRRHVAQGLNIALTCLLYMVSGAIIGGLLSISSAVTAFAIMVPLAVAGWIVTAAQLLLAGAAASRGEYYPVPSWLCSRLVR